MVVCSAVSVAQSSNLNQIEGGLETNKRSYATRWVCTGDTLAIDTTSNDGIVCLIDGFWITCQEITQDLWQYYMHYNPSVEQGELLPVTNISRSEADTFCHRITIGNGPQWRLPTLEEWRFAYNGGIFSESYQHSGSNKINFVGWTAHNSGGKLHQVGKLIPNELGLYDMDGNVWELVTYGDSTLCAGRSFRQKVIKSKSHFTIKPDAIEPECIGLRPVMREPLWFDIYENRIFRQPKL